MTLDSVISGPDDAPSSLLRTAHLQTTRRRVVGLLGIGTSAGIGMFAGGYFAWPGGVVLGLGTVAVLSLGGLIATVATRLLLPGIGSLQEMRMRVDTLNRQTKKDMYRHERLQRRLHRNRREDDLTKLGNRRFLVEKIRALLERGQTEYGVVFLDLDRFKVINDSLGHEVGDRLLLQVASQLQAIVRETGDVVRLGGDEFAVWYEGVSAEVVRRQAREIRRGFNQAMVLDGRDVTTTASVGVVLGDRRYRRVEELLRDGDTAMNRAKLRGRNQVAVFDTEMYEDAKREHAVQEELQRAWQEDRFEVYYQPIVDVRSRRVRSYEALLRIRRTDGELLGPDKFVGVAEESGLIVPITWWLLNTTLQNLRAWQDQGCAVRVSINLSNKSLMQKRLITKVRAALERHGVAAADVTLEVLESAITEQEGQVHENLLELRAMGVRISIDDFGVGYSNLSRLHEMPVDTLKIDQSYVRNLDGHGRAIVQMIMDLARGLGFKVVAEGVEREDQRQVLEEMECEEMQGYLYAKPMPRGQVVEFTRRLARDGAGRDELGRPGGLEMRLDKIRSRR